MGNEQGLLPGLMDAMRDGCQLAGWLLTHHVRASVLELIGDVSPVFPAEQALGQDLWAICWCRLAAWPGRGGDVLARVALAVVRDLETERHGAPVLLGAAVEQLVAPQTRAPQELLRKALRRGVLRSDQCRLLIGVDVIGLSCSELSRRDGTDEVRLRRRRREALEALARDPGAWDERGWLSAT